MKTGQSNKNGLNVDKFILQDYSFLQDYQIIEGKQSNRWNFIAKIKNTMQFVKFTKIQYNNQLLKRFSVLVQLYRDGVILADNLFILQQNHQLYFYIIQAHIDPSNPRFQTLQNYLSVDRNLKTLKDIFNKVKVLLEKVHQSGEIYAGLNSNKIIIDDEENIYLAPFGLVYQLQTNNYENAYRPPQILQRIISQNYEVEGLQLLKWDYWSFGCICMQIFYTASPLYYSTSIGSLIKNINKMKISQYMNNQEKALNNLIMNALNKQANYRSLSSENQDNLLKTRKLRKIDLVKQKRQLCKQKCMDMQNTLAINETAIEIKNSDHKKLYTLSQEQNINLINEEDQFIMHLLSISEVQIQEELNIVVHLDRKYNFYIDKLQKTKNIHINKKINIKATFRKFQQMLDTPIIIQLKQTDKQGIIQVNLQTLVMVYDGKRVWDKLLIGSYPVNQPNQHYKNTKIKLTCQINTKNSERQKKQQKNKNHVEIKHKKQQQIQNENQQQKQNENIEAVTGKVDSKNIVDKKCVKEIDKVKQQLTNLAEHWKNRKVQKSIPRQTINRDQLTKSKTKIY